MSKEAVLSSSQKELESTAEEKDIWNTSKDNVHLLYTVYKIRFSVCNVYRSLIMVSTACTKNRNIKMDITFLMKMIRK